MTHDKCIADLIETLLSGLVHGSPYTDHYYFPDETAYISAAKLLWDHGDLLKRPAIIHENPQISRRALSPRVCYNYTTVNNKSYIFIVTRLDEGLSLGAYSTPGSRSISFFTDETL